MSQLWRPLSITGIFKPVCAKIFKPAQEISGDRHLCPSSVPRLHLQRASPLCPLQRARPRDVHPTSVPVLAAVLDDGDVEAPERHREVDVVEHQPVQMSGSDLSSHTVDYEVAKISGIRGVT